MPRAAVSAGARLVVRSPATGEAIGVVPIMGAPEVRALVDRARAAQPAWAALGPEARARALLRFRDRLAARAEAVAELSSRETGKLVFEALTLDVLVTCDLARWYARRAPHVLRRRRVPSGWIATKRAYVLREPYGVVGVIGPWNLPVLNTMRSVLAALAAGNAVVLKPSEASPLSALLMAELAREAGIPEDVFLVATGDGTTGEALVLAGVDKLSFTGSIETGRKVARLAAERLVPTTLELGGKDAMIVLAGADLERAAQTAVAGAFWNAGQICVSVERVFVEAAVYDAFVQRVVELASTLEIGASAEADVGALTLASQIPHLERQIRDALDRGARLLLGGRRLPGPGRFFPPTILVDVDPSMEIMREESFGPVLPIMKVADAEEAIRLANDTRFGLGSSIWGERSRVEALVPRIRAGMTCVNDALANGMVAALPFGGIGESGYGTTYGDDGLREMSRVRSVLVDRAGVRHEILYYPLRRFGRDRVLALVRLLHGPGLRARIGALRRLLARRL